MAFAVYEYAKKTTQKRLYWIAFGALTLMLCLRYGQGTDYFGYNTNYILTSSFWDIRNLFESDIHGEIGWLILCSLCRTIKLPFEAFVVGISVFEMYCLHRFVSRYSPMQTVTLLLFYPTLFLTYTMSTLRQGIVLLIFLGFMLQWLQENKIVPYLVMTGVCTLFHTSALIFLVLIAIQIFPLNTKRMLWLLVASVATGIVCSKVLPMISSVFSYYASRGVSLVAIAERLLSTAVILFVMHDTLEQKENTVPWLLMQIYLYGTLIYCLLMWNSLISSRFAVYFKSVEVVLFAIAIITEGKRARIAALYVLGLTVLMYMKNINSYIREGGYYGDVNVWNYPYFSLLNKDVIYHRFEKAHDFFVCVEKYKCISGVLYE